MQRHKVPDLSRITKQAGETVWLREPITLPNGQVITKGQFAGNSVSIVEIPVQTSLGPGGLKLGLPIGMMLIRLVLDDGETTITVPNTAVAYVSQNKDFPQPL